MEVLKIKVSRVVLVLIIISLCVISSCGKKPADVITGDWRGEGEVNSPAGAPVKMNFYVSFYEDGSCSITPEDEATGEGTYFINNDGNITARVAIPGAADEALFEGSLDTNTERVNLRAKIAPTDEEYQQVLSYYQSLKRSYEIQGKKFTEKIPTVEDLTIVMTMSLTKVGEN